VHVLLPAALAFFIFVAVFFVPPARSAGKPPVLSGKFVIVLIAGVTPEEMPSSDTPFIGFLANAWSDGLMSCRTDDKVKKSVVPGGPTGAEYMALGWGVGTDSATGADLSFNSTEAVGSTNAGQLFKTYNDLAPPPLGVVALGWQQVRLANDNPTGNKFAGELGTVLAQHGKVVAVAGNQDTASEPSRPAALVCCDSKGRVPLGDVGAALASQTSASAGMERTSEAKLEAVSAALLQKADLLVDDTGDMGRIDSAVPVSSDSAIASDRRRALARADRIVESIALRLDMSTSTLLVLSPTAQLEERLKGDFFTPIVVAGKGMGKGRVTSGSTRRAGIITNLDVMPTVLSFFGIGTPKGAGGSKIQTTTSGSHDQLVDLSKQVGWTTRARWPVAITYFALYLILLFVSALVIARANGKVNWPEKAGVLAEPLRFLALGLLAGALSMVVISIVPYSGYVLPLVFCTLFAAVLVVLAWLLERWKPLLDGITTLCLLFVLVMIVDQFTGGRLQLLPLVGSTQLEGLRFFGIGNVIAALTIACTTWGAAGILRGYRDRSWASPGSNVKRAWLAVLFLLVLGVVSLGALGANVGALIYGSVTFGVFLFALSKKGITWLRGLYVALATVGLLVVSELLDAVVFRTHASKSVKGGLTEMFRIIGQKLANHLAEIKFVLIPAIVMMIVVLIVVLLMRKKDGFAARMWSEERERSSALFACLVGAFVGLFFEDTGVTVMGAMVVICTCAMAYYTLARLPGTKKAPATASVIEPALRGSA
jgi:hypothetical protein